MVEQHDRPDEPAGGSRRGEPSGEDETFPEDFRRLMRRIFGPLNRLRDRR